MIFAIKAIERKDAKTIADCLVALGNVISIMAEKILLNAGERNWFN